MTRAPMTARVACLVLMAVSACAHGLDLTRHISQYGHTAWRMQDGFFPGAPNAITQTTDGYLWIGTKAGLLRFDGVRFARFVPPAGQDLASQDIESLLGASDGSLWIGTGSGLFRWQGGALTSVGYNGGLIDNISEGVDGTIWIARSRVANHGALCKIQGTQLKCYGREDGFPFDNAQFQVPDRLGTVWMSGGDTLVRWTPESVKSYKLPGLHSVTGLAGINAMSPSADGSLWVGASLAGPGLGLQRFVDEKWQAYSAEKLEGASISVNTLMQDRKGALWVGTYDGGIYRILGEKVDHFQASDGLSGNGVCALFEDREGDIWIATANGIDRLRDLKVGSISSREGLKADSVNSVLAARDGTVWFGNHNALESFREDVITTISRSNGLPGTRVTSLMEDHMGRLWVGVDDGLYILRGKTFEEILSPDGKRAGIVTAMVEDHGGTVWVQLVNPFRLAHIVDFKVREQIDESWSEAALDLAADPGGGLWLGLNGGGLALLRNGQQERHAFGPIESKWYPRVITVMSDGTVFGATKQGVIAWHNGLSQTITARNGLPCNNMRSLIPDKLGALWLVSECGLIEIPAADIQALWANGNAKIHPVLIGPSEGFSPGFPSFRPASAIGADGTLWFANEYEAQFIDPANVSFNNIPPPVHIEAIVADHQALTPLENLSIAPLTRSLEIDYTALSLAMPERVLFRYRLDGYDKSWEDPGSRRVAFYNDLAPGRYTFHVMAANSDGVWNQSGASLTFRVEAAWYQTRVFQMVCLILASVAIWAIYRLRMHQISSALRVRFDERLSERTRLASELHDTLLQTIQGSKLVADEAIEKADAEDMQGALSRLSQWLEQAIQEGRAALNSLRVLTTNQFDLGEALAAAARSQVAHSAMEVSFSVAGNVRELRSVARDEVYRIAFEAIRNVCIHSSARHLKVELMYSDDLTVRVLDDGIGIEEKVIGAGKHGHFGLHSMRERAKRIHARLVISSQNQTGTEVMLIVPGKYIFGSDPLS